MLEATDCIGGRIRSSKNLNNNPKFSSWPIELGAEEIHGEDSYLKDLAEKAGAKLIERDQINDFITY